MTDIASHEKVRTADQNLRRRAAAVIPGGMYGHMTVGRLPAAFPQFWERSKGTHVWDVDGNEYVDFMCSFGPMILGYQHPDVEAAAAALKRAEQDLDGPIELLAEEIRAGVRALEILIGKIDVETVLGEIFARFCIGK